MTIMSIQNEILKIYQRRQIKNFQNFQNFQKFFEPMKKICTWRTVFKIIRRVGGEGGGQNFD